MKRLFLFLAIFLQAGGQPIVIPIQNPSFESPVTFQRATSVDVDGVSCGQAEWGSVPGWEITSNAPGSAAGVIAWAGHYPDPPYSDIVCSQVPDGQNVAFLLNSSIYQDLGVLPQVGIYAMKVSFANWFYNYPAQYTVALTIGKKPVCWTSAYATGDFVEIPIVCPMPSYIASASPGFGFTVSNLGILIQDTDWTLLPDKVSLTFTPSN